MKKVHLIEEDETIDSWVYGMKTQPIALYLFIFKLNSLLPTIRFHRKEDFTLFTQTRLFAFEQFAAYDSIHHIHYQFIQNYSIPQNIESPFPTLFETESVTEILLKKFKEYNLILKCNYPLSEEFLVHLSDYKTIIQIQDLSTAPYKFIKNIIS